VTVSDEYYIMWKETEMAHFKEVPGPTEGKWLNIAGLQVKIRLQTSRIESKIANNLRHLSQWSLIRNVSSNF
jgi:hypothetical protein